MTVICRPWITVKGVRIYAKERGLQAFCFDVEVVKPRNKKAEPSEDGSTKPEN